MPITSSGILHRKVPSLYLKKEYNTNPTNIYTTRNTSVEKGVLSISKDSKDTSLNTHMPIRRNNFVEVINAGSLESNRLEPASTNRVLKVVSNSNRTSAVSSRDDHKVRDRSKEIGVHSTNSSVEKLKQTFLV